MVSGDHFYKENDTLPLEEQMITAMPDVMYRELLADDEFIIIACDGIWYIQSMHSGGFHLNGANIGAF